MKENLSTINAGEGTRRLTRSQAAVLRASGQTAPSRTPKQLEQKMTMKSNTKKAALAENNSNATDNSFPQRKRKAVLQDVTNVCCESSYRKWLNATKIRAKSSKQVQKLEGKVSKVSTSVGVHNSELPADGRKEIPRVTLEAEPKLEVTCQTDSEAKTSPPLISENECGLDDHQLEKQSSGMPSQPRSPSKKDEKGFFNGSLLRSSGPHIRDIDSDHKDPQLCSLYAPVIYSNLLVAELCRRPCTDFMETKQQDITQSMRGILVDWLVEVSEEYKLVPDTLYLTVYLIDLYLSQNYIERQRLQLLGITCMLIASKYEEICAPRVEEFCFITDSTYTKAEVLKMEFQVLNYFGFQIFAPTAKTFLRRILRAAQALYMSPSLELEYLANFLAEMTLLDYNFLNFLPSVIAASAVFLARWTLDPSSHPWNPTLEHYSSYKASDLKTTVIALQDLQLNTNGCPLNAIRMKYRQNKFKSVAALTSPKLLETLF